MLLFPLTLQCMLQGDPMVSSGFKSCSKPYAVMPFCFSLALLSFFSTSLMVEDMQVHSMGGSDDTGEGGGWRLCFTYDLCVHGNGWLEDSCALDVQSLEIRAAVGILTYLPVTVRLTLLLLSETATPAARRRVESCE